MKLLCGELQKTFFKKVFCLNHGYCLFVNSLTEFKNSFDD